MSPPIRRTATAQAAPRAGLQRAAWWTIAVVLASLPLAASLVHGHGAAAAEASAAPVLSCPGGMVLDSASGTCLTERTETAARSVHCRAGWSRIAGPSGSVLCQLRTERQVDTGRTQHVYSHTTYSDVWISTGTEFVQTGTRLVWVPPRTTVYPLVPPVRVQVGTETVTTQVTMPGPPVTYLVSYEVEVTQTTQVQRCAFDPYAGEMCWYETVTETVTETRTSLVCCEPGPDIVQTIISEVPVYEWQTTSTSTEPGYWDTEPVYSERETGYWHTVESVHYTSVPVYETVVDVQTQAPSYGACDAGWQPVGQQCRRTALGPPSAAPTQTCPSGAVPHYGDALGGGGPSALTCQSAAPGSNTDSGDSPEDSGGSEESPDGGARPLHHLAGESDERLADLGIHRCANGLLSYVPCDELPGRTWDSDADVCDGIEGTAYRPDHGGTCVTGSDVLNKCTTPGACEDTTIRTYCPAIGELADTQIQEHVHPDRGAETYRVCVFDCSSFGTLPPYVQTRINGSYDYACLPAPEQEPPPTTTTAPSSTTTTAPPTSTTAPGDDDDSEADDGEHEDGEPGDSEDPGDPPDSGRPDTTVATTEPASTPDPQCPTLPPTPLPAADTAALVWESRVRSAGAASGFQLLMPGGGRHLQVAPGRGWMRALRAVEISDPDCTWKVTQMRTAWSELRPWIAAERQRIEAEPSAAHLVQRWDGLGADQQQLLRQWHRSGVAPAVTVCAIADAVAATASSDCDWLFRHPGAYAWRLDACFEVSPVPEPPGSNGNPPPGNDGCWATLASGVDWIRPLSDYADDRVTVTQNGAQP